MLIISLFFILSGIFVFIFKYKICCRSIVKVEYFFKRNKIKGIGNIVNKKWIEIYLFIKLFFLFMF